MLLWGIISIHALRKESDQGALDDLTEAIGISIHALRKESDDYRQILKDGLFEFQSTLSVRRATPKAAAFVVVFSFQSTLSVRRATRQGRDRAVGHGISIHALRKESDGCPTGGRSGWCHFNPRSP